jgi:hypothetical protein
MTAQRLIANWKIFTGKLRQRYATWLADETQYREGKQTELVGRILKKSERSDHEKEESTMASFGSCGR